MKHTKKPGRKDCLVQWPWSSFRPSFPLLVTLLCGVTGLFGALRRAPRRGAERRRMCYNAERCNEQRRTCFGAWWLSWRGICDTVKHTKKPGRKDCLVQWPWSSFRPTFPLLVTPLCGVTGLFGALRRAPRRGAERRRMCYTAERCNKQRKVQYTTLLQPASVAPELPKKGGKPPQPGTLRLHGDGCPALRALQLMVAFSVAARPRQDADSHHPGRCCSRALPGCG